MGGSSAPLTVEQGATSSLYLLLAPEETINANGELFGDDHVIGYV
jgi:hypothetical protein